MVEHRRIALGTAGRHNAGGSPARHLVVAVVAISGVILAALSQWLTDVAQIVVLSAGVALVVAGAFTGLGDGLRCLRRRGMLGLIRNLAEADAHAVLATDEDGRVLYLNPVALDRFGDCRNGSLEGALSSFFASPRSALLRLRAMADRAGRAEDTVEMRRGPMQVTVQPALPGLYLWRFEFLAAPVLPEEPAPEPSLPCLILGPQGAILSQNAAMRSLAGRRALSVDDLFDDPPVTAGRIHSLRTKEGPVPVLAIEPARQADRREIYFVPQADLPRPAPIHDIEALPVPVIELSETGILLQANAQARGLLGEGAEAGQRLERLVEGLGRPLDSWLKEAAYSPRRMRSEVVRVSDPDSERFLQITLGLHASDRAGGFTAVLQDATELKTLEAQFVQSQKMQAIGQLAGGVAHDFNNLLTAITGHCDLLLLRHDPADPDYPDLEQINQNANRAASLVSQLLAFSRKQTLRPELVDLRDALSDLSHLLNRLVGEKIRLELRHDPNQRRVRADRRQFEQVIMNLVVNARDAMPDGGRILIETREEHLEAPLQWDRAEVPRGDYVVVRVSDEGTGIGPDKLGKIFEPFYTTKRQGEGTGLGLSTAYGIVKQSGGFIFAESEAERGTTFTMYLPSHAHPAAEHALPEPVRPEPARRHDGVVLLVEDEAPVRAFAARALRLRGLTVLEADNAESALEMLDRVDTAIDVFVTDVIMPGRDGPSWVQEALESRPETRVVFMSGYAEESFADAQALIPNSVFLPKPFSLSQLTGLVQEQLG